jgi:hypothetical protein
VSDSFRSFYYFSQFVPSLPFRTPIPQLHQDSAETAYSYSAQDLELCYCHLISAQALFGEFDSTQAQYLKS